MHHLLSTPSTIFSPGWLACWQRWSCPTLSGGFHLSQQSLILRDSPVIIKAKSISGTCCATGYWSTGSTCSYASLFPHWQDLEDQLGRCALCPCPQGCLVSLDLVIVFSGINVAACVDEQQRVILRGTCCVLFKKLWVLKVQSFLNHLTSRVLIKQKLKCDVPQIFFFSWSCVEILSFWQITEK